ncbi:unnamed protein product [Prunus armeniaca]|uniref:Uncharacterized protein n=1 Tax=Prunus armeniaca TaxID=36596 RepID=A0A6J5W4X0_PRUAR|nr:unnamed protein product [Prunus armeniaca]CAB4294694.1 unnamed protein product [Prunus armeniaca]
MDQGLDWLKKSRVRWIKGCCVVGAETVLWGGDCGLWKDGGAETCGKMGVTEACGRMEVLEACGKVEVPKACGRMEVPEACGMMEVPNVAMSCVGVNGTCTGGGGPRVATCAGEGEAETT